MQQKVLLMILDGWGIAQDASVSAIDQAHTPFVDSLYTSWPHATLLTSGLDVGLPEGQMGNSEVGHMNIGAGRVVYQDLVRINKAIESGEFGSNPALQEALTYAREQDKALHLMGLFSDGGVHAHIDHLVALCKEAHRQGLNKIYIHAFTDGRDTDPKAGVEYLRGVEKALEGNPAQVVSVIGRYYAMDRDKRWERVKKAYDTLTMAHPPEEYKRLNLEEAIFQQYAQGVTDEFLPPLIKTKVNGERIAYIKPGDAVICFNFRTDRGREITMALTQQDFPEQEMTTLPLHYVTMTQYDAAFKGVHVMFSKDDLRNTLGEVISQAGKRQIRIAETEKYPHVTFFFSGGREEPFQGEKRLLCPSPKVATYDLKPEMSAYEIRDAILPELEAASADFICLNFANPDMVGHTGVMEAAIKACEVVDECTKSVAETALAHGYACLIIADHGNADKMSNEDGSPNTAHTTHPVPFFLLGANGVQALQSGRLADIAPTVLSLMGLPQPPEMTGAVLAHE
jgi:2,3-bisphosphoglycerate-independent phosphoglycerate mutase